jgi:hypothetical protein
MTAKPKVGPVGDDGFQWVEGLISNPDGWTLRDVRGGDVDVAYLYRCTDGTWRGVWAGDPGGTVIADGHAKAGQAMAAVNDAARPCSYVDTHASHGIVACDNERQPGSHYCPPHAKLMERDA